MSKYLDINVAWLDGYLGALSSVNGDIREFFSCAFLMDRCSKKSVLEEITDYFLPDASFSCSKIDDVTDWDRYLEKNIGEFLLIRPLNSTVSEKDLLERRLYLTFRLMNIISDILGDGNSAILHDIEGCFQGDKNDTRFFVIASEKYYVIMQFMHGE